MSERHNKTKRRFEDNLPVAIAVTAGVLTAAFALIGGLPGDAAKDTGSVAAAPAADSSSDATPSPDTEATAAPTDAPDAAPPPATSAGDEMRSHDLPPSGAVSPASADDAAAADMSPLPEPVYYADNMRLDTANLSFRASFPRGAHEVPAYRKLMDDMNAYRKQLRADSDAASKLASDSKSFFSPWDVSVDVRELARAGQLVSIVKTETSSKSGVHPDRSFDAILANAETGERMAVRDLFLPRKANTPALAIAICEAVKTLKTERIGEATIDDAPIECQSPETEEQLKNGQWALAGSTVDGHFGGVIVYYAPYAIGSYAEGSYQATIPQTLFREDLRPLFRDLFAGDPVAP